MAKKKEDLRSRNAHVQVRDVSGDKSMALPIKWTSGAGLGRCVWVSAEHLMNLVDSTGARWLFLCSHTVAKVFLVLRQASMNP